MKKTLPKDQIKRLQHIIDKERIARVHQLMVNLEVSQWEYKHDHEHNSIPSDNIHKTSIRQPIHSQHDGTLRPDHIMNVESTTRQIAQAKVPSRFMNLVFVLGWNQYIREKQYTDITDELGKQSKVKRASVSKQK